MNGQSKGHLEKMLVSHIVEHTSASLTAEAELAARKEVLWCIGTSIAGASAPGSAAVRDYVRGLGGPPEATVFGTGDKVPAHLAVFANGTYAKALEYEDKMWIGTSHGYGVGMAVVPAALAAAESVGGVDRVAFIDAVAVATDFHIRLISAVPDSTFGRSGFNSSYIFWVFGATAAACRIMKLSHEQTSNALGLAYAQASGNYQGQIEGVLGVRLQGGFGGRNAIMAAQLAAAGIDGVAEFLTGDCGLFPLYFGHIEPDLDSVSEDLGTHYRGETLGFKAHPCGLVCHAALDSLRSLTQGRSLDVEAITAIRVFGGARLLIMTEPREHRRNPRNYVEAQFSVPWAVACTLLHGKLRLSDFDDDSLDDPRCRRLSNMVEVDIDPSRQEQYVELDFDDGSMLRSDAVTVARGHPRNPLSDEEICEIIEDCLSFGPDASVSASAQALPSLLLGEGVGRFSGTDDLSMALQAGQS